MKLTIHIHAPEVEYFKKFLRFVVKTTYLLV